MLPKVLIGCTISQANQTLIENYVGNAINLLYKNKEILIIDSTQNEKFSKALEKNKWVRVERTEKHSNFEYTLRDNRNLLREHALREGFDYLLSLEPDIIAPKDVIQRLLAREKDLVSALTFNYSETRLSTNQFMLALTPVMITWADPTQKDLELVRDLTFEEVFPSRLFEIFECGFNCLLISRKVLEKVVFKSTRRKNSCNKLFFADARHNNFHLFLDSSVICRHLFSALPREIEERL